MKHFALPILLILALALAACAPQRADTDQPAPVAAPVWDNTDTSSTAPSEGNTSGLTRADEQGAVTFEITPLNLDLAADTLEFDVSMNTHSVDLNMDLAQLATLSTDTGLTVQATKWDATPGGHHVPGKLIFPATQDGKALLDGAGKLTITITNVDAPSRVFEWALQ